MAIDFRTRVRTKAAWIVALLLTSGLAATGCGARKCATCELPADNVSPTCGNADKDTWDKLKRGLAEANPAPNVLLLSGGGSFGAWGAGVLNGWSNNQAHPRPTFQLVTGSSTGAILGTWAFVGSEADAYAKCAYTNTSDDDVYNKALASWIWLQPWRWSSIKPWESLKNLGPLRDLFRRYTPKEVIAKVGEIYEKEDRVFLTGTVDLDLGKFCIWDMGKIAAEMNAAAQANNEKLRQQKYDFYMEVVMASSSNPGIFNPTFVPSRIGGDMHVDGGVRHQLFFESDVAQAVESGVKAWQVRTAAAAIPAAPRSRVQAISDPECNSAGDPEMPTMYAVANLPAVVPRLCTGDDIYHIAQRSLTVLTIQSLIADLGQAKAQWKEQYGGSMATRFCVSRIPDTMTTWPFADDFPECQMRDLYAAARDQTEGPQPWESALPAGGASPLPCAEKEKCCGKRPPTCPDVVPGCKPCELEPTGPGCAPPLPAG